MNHGEWIYKENSRQLTRPHKQYLYFLNQESDPFWKTGFSYGFKHSKWIIVSRLEPHEIRQGDFNVFLRY